MLFGTHDGERGGEIEAALERTISVHRGKLLSSAEAYRSWGARFFPAGLTGDLPVPTPAMVPIPGLEEIHLRLQDEAAHLAVQGTISRGGETLLIAFRIGEDGRLQTPGEKDREALLRIARQAGGGEYLVGLRRYEGYPRRDALLQLKDEVDPGGILGAVR